MSPGPSQGLAFVVQLGSHSLLLPPHPHHTGEGATTHGGPTKTRDYQHWEHPSTLMGLGPIVSGPGWSGYLPVPVLSVSVIPGFNWAPMASGPLHCGGVDVPVGCESPAVLVWAESWLGPGLIVPAFVQWKKLYFVLWIYLYRSGWGCEFPLDREGFVFVLPVLQTMSECSRVVLGFILLWIGVGWVGGYPPWDQMGVDGAWHHCTGACVLSVPGFSWAPVGSGPSPCDRGEGVTVGCGSPAVPHRIDLG